MVRKHRSKKRKASYSHFIKDVRSGMNHVSLKARVSAIVETEPCYDRFLSLRVRACLFLCKGAGGI